MLLLTIAKYETPSGRLIQRDYSNGNLYDYYTQGGSLRNENQPAKPKGAEKKTDTGRIVYSGGGIQPDELIKPETISSERFNQQLKVRDGAIFNFALDLAFGKIPGYETYKIDRPIRFGYNLNSNDFPVTENLFQSFKQYASDKYKISGALIDKEREFITQVLRSELVIAAYGSTTSYQVSNENSNVLKKAVELLPKAKQLAMESSKITEKRAGAIQTKP
jgi:carboxyl-terminal processing protease